MNDKVVSLIYFLKKLIVTVILSFLEVAVDLAF